MNVDPVTDRNHKSSLLYASEEMGIAVRNSAYSPNIKERLDHSCALSIGTARLIAQAEHIPVHLGLAAVGIARNAARSSTRATAACARARCGSSTIRTSRERI